MKHLAQLALIVMSLTSFTAGASLSERLDSLFLPLFPAHEPGVAVCVAQGDDVIYERYMGLADLETREPVTARTNFCIASVSKQFSAVALLQLVEQGLVKLDDAVVNTFPEFAGHVPTSVTWHHILSHTSGIPDARDRRDRNFVLYATDVASVAYMEHLDHLNFAPGTAYEYINPTFQLVYQLVPRLTGVDFETWVQLNLLDVAGMTQSQYFEPQRAIAHMAHGYTPTDDGRFRELDYGEETFFATKADGGLYTSVRDFLKWEQALRDLTVWNENSRRLAYTPHIAIPEGANYGYQPGVGYGYGFFVQQLPGRPTVVYHTGDNGGFTIYAGKIPSRDVKLLIFSTRDDIDRMLLVNRALDIILQER